MDLEPDNRIKEIYKVTSFMYVKVKIELPKLKADVVQFYCCQRLGHTKAYCTHTPVCVKCGKEHMWRKCNKPADVKPTCGNCGSEHTANYRCCPEIKKAIPPRPKKSTQPQQTWSITVADAAKSYVEATSTFNKATFTRTTM